MKRQQKNASLIRPIIRSTDDVLCQTPKSQVFDSILPLNAVAVNSEMDPLAVGNTETDWKGTKRNETKETDTDKN